jgi:hypothetical protein
MVELWEKWERGCSRFFAHRRKQKTLRLGVGGEHFSQTTDFASTYPWKRNSQDDWAAEEIKNQGDVNYRRTRKVDIHSMMVEQAHVCSVCLEDAASICRRCLFEPGSSRIISSCAPFFFSGPSLRDLTAEVSRYRLGLGGGKGPRLLEMGLH